MTSLPGQDVLDDGKMNRLAEISPVNHVRPGLPPFLLIQGSADRAVACDLTVNFQAKLKSAGVSCDLHTLTNAQHRIADWEKFDPDFPTKIVAWLNEKLPAK